MPKAKGQLAGLLAAVHRQEWLDRTDPKAGAALRAQTTAKFQTEFLPGGKSCRLHWRKWIAAVAKAEGVSEKDIEAYFDGAAVLASKTKEGEVAREDLCRTAWKQFPHVII